MVHALNADYSIVEARVKPKQAPPDSNAENMSGYKICDSGSRLEAYISQKLLSLSAELMAISFRFALQVKNISTIAEP
jgi:hypothetical protein